VKSKKYGSLLLLLSLLLLAGCDDGGQAAGLRDLSPTQLLAKPRTLKMPGPIRNYWPAPDGGKLLVMDDQMNMSMVDLAKGDAISAVRLVVKPTLPTVQVEWTPDSAAFAYSAAVKSNGNTSTIIHIYDLVKRTELDIAEGSDIAKPYSPAWNSKGTSLYFLAWRGGKQQVMNVGRDGKNLTPMFVTTDKPSEQADFIRPTPDSTHFVYNIRDISTTVLQGGIYVTEADGSNRHLLATEPSVSALHMSPRGDSVLVEQNRGTYVVTATFSSILWLSPTRVGDRKLLLPFPKAMTNTPPEVLSGATTIGAAWSPAGDKIIYITRNYAATAEPPRSLWIVNADSGDPAEVYTSAQETDLSLPEAQTLVWAGNDSVVTSNLGDTFTIIQLDKKQLKSELSSCADN
jgi:hypothetical protein